jgi:hypothetical protein
MTTPDSTVPSDTDRLADIRARLDAATPGPWKASVVDSPRSTCSTAIYSHAYAAGDARSEVLPSYPIKAGYARMRRADAVLMANARDDLAHLLGLVGDLQGQLDKARALHQPVPEAGQGYDKDGNYVTIERPCGACGTYDEYATPWPCATARALGLGGEATDGE